MILKVIIEFMNHFFLHQTLEAAAVSHMVDNMMSALLCRNIKCIREVRGWTRITRLFCVTRLLFKRAPSRGKGHGSHSGVRNVLIWEGSGVLYALVCVCVPVPVCMTKHMFACVSMCANVHIEVCEWVGVRSAPL